jgi:2-keto-4-pentenoate hydratase/2-oxohepta-3-ene-1,7-dioic acid hydratase in catechol pathway
MKFLSFQSGKDASYGAVVGDGVVDLGKRLGKKYPTLRAALAAGALAELTKVASGAKKTDLPLKKVKYLPVIPDARKIICVGLNYKPMIKPRESDKLDWEGELAVIIGRGGRRIAREKAMNHIAGYACYHDGSVRDYQRHTTQFTPGKNFAATGGFGPWMVTKDEVGDITKQTLTTRVNGVVKQQAGIDLLIFDIPALIAYISVFVPLEGGDVIVTGTPGGVGAARTPPEFMKPGDVAEIEITGVGTLRNVVKEG